MARFRSTMYVVSAMLKRKDSSLFFKYLERKSMCTRFLRCRMHINADIVQNCLHISGVVGTIFWKGKEYFKQMVTKYFLMMAWWKSLSKCIFLTLWHALYRILYRVSQKSRISREVKYNYIKRWNKELFKIQPWVIYINIPKLTCSHNNFSLKAREYIDMS